MGKRVSGPALLLVMLAFSLITGDVLVLARQDPQNQPATPQTPTQTQTQQTPTQTETQQRTNKPRRGKRKRGQMGTTTGTADQTATPGETTTPATGTGETMSSSQTMTTGAESTQTDLSGTYTGNFNCDALGLTGNTTLTISGNQFTTSDGKSGRIVATTTRGYTAVALQTGDVGTGTGMAGMSGMTTTTKPAATTATGTTPTGTTPTGTSATGTTVSSTGGTEMAGMNMSGAPQIVSLRAHRSGNRLTLMSVPGSTMRCSFTPGSSRRSRHGAAATTGATVTTPAEAGPAPADVTVPAKPARTRRGSTRRNPSTTTTPSAMPSSTNPTTQPAPESPMPAQTPSPQPSPAPSPSPNPNPTGSPTPVPNPSPSPTTTPSPTPSPSPGRPRG